MVEKSKRPSRMFSMLAFVNEVVWPRSLDSMAGRLLGALSIFALARYSFDFGLSAAVAELFSYYDDVLRILLGWLDPIIQPFMRAIFDRLGIHVEFNEYWRHVFVVMQMLFARDAGVAFASKRRVVALIRFLVGTIIAAAVSFCAALKFSFLPIQIQNAIFATWPIVGIYLYDVAMYMHSAMFQINYVNDVENMSGRSRWQFLRSALRRGTVRLVFGLAVAYVSFALPSVYHASFPAGGLMAIGLATIANAAYWIGRGAQFATRERSEGEQWVQAFRRSEAGRFGAAVAGVIVWVVVFASINAGMRQLGL